MWHENVVAKDTYPLKKCAIRLLRPLSRTLINTAACVCMCNSEFPNAINYKIILLGWNCCFWLFWSLFIQFLVRAIYTVFLCVCLFLRLFISPHRISGVFAPIFFLFCSIAQPNSKQIHGCVYSFTLNDNIFFSFIHFNFFYISSTVVAVDVAIVVIVLFFWYLFDIIIFEKVHISSNSFIFLFYFVRRWQPFIYFFFSFLSLSLSYFYRLLMVSFLKWKKKLYHSLVRCFQHLCPISLQYSILLQMGKEAS